MFEHCYQLRVRYKDIDYLGVVYYSRYFEYFEAARDEMMRSLGLPYSEFEQRGYAMPVVEAQCYYHRGARFDDDLIVFSRITEMPHSRLKIDYEICTLDTQVKIVSGYTIHAFINQSGKAVRPPSFFLQLLAPKLS